MFSTFIYSFNKEITYKIIKSYFIDFLSSNEIPVSKYLNKNLYIVKKAKFINR